MNLTLKNVWSAFCFCCGTRTVSSLSSDVSPTLTLQTREPLLLWQWPTVYCYCSCCDSAAIHLPAAMAPLPLMWEPTSTQHTQVYTQHEGYRQGFSRFFLSFGQGTLYDHHSWGHIFYSHVFLDQFIQFWTFWVIFHHKAELTSAPNHIRDTDEKLPSCLKKLTNCT